MVSELGRLLWAKTWRKGWGREVPPGASWHSLIAHVWDSGHAGGWLWDHLLAERVRRLLADDLDGCGESARARLSWLAADHDLGKATPPFAGLDGQRRADLVAAGLAVDLSVKGVLPHGWLSGRLVYEFLCDDGWDPAAAEFVALTLAGHHGIFPGVGWLGERVKPKRRGTGAWKPLQAEVHEAAVMGSGAARYHEEWSRSLPSVAAQLVQAGAVTLADWLASNEDLFPYEGRLPDGYLDTSASRVGRAGEVMGVRAAWTPDSASVRMGAQGLFGSRFEVTAPRDVQRAVYELACSVTGPGLMLIEAPMGEGKTEAALGAAEVLAARLGANGVFFGLPTQATANQIFRRVLKWLERQGADTTVALAHGKAARQEDYRALLHAAVEAEGCGAGAVGSKWILGRYRALLAPVVVATVDQLLLAGLASRYVSVRMLGLAGKVVVLDEVHAYDAYMSGLLHGVLAWLGACGVPVVLLSATLPAKQRAELVQAYAGRPTEVMDDAVYPRLTWVDAPATAGEGESPWVVAAATDRRLPVKVAMLPEPDVTTVADEAKKLVAGGGCLLVIRNTVARAQELAEELRRALGVEAVTLMHARFTVADRRRLETGLVERFGPEGTRPMPHVVVATQVVEQSLDVSFDGLITDLCPIDLLFQRIGREHRHPAVSRPQLMRDARVVVAGYQDRPCAPPQVPRGSRTVYGEHLLWRTAAALRDCATLELPGDIPRLVNRVYGTETLGPDSWQEELAAAAQADEDKRERMADQARQIALKNPHAVETLADLHDVGALSGDDDENTPQVQALVRLGQPSLEVILLRAGDTDGTAFPVSQGAEGSVPLDRLPEPAVVERVLDQAIRLPGWSERLTDAAQEAAFTPEAWKGSAWLGSVRVLLLPADGRALRLGGQSLTYCPREGLTVSAS
ncbi:CRISPR-associated helicase Cas3' [Streptomyces sp. BHT-5-2]|uniref:CRISPR-associated helicase Cas3' n=1 Tax=Streptomyces sp. BHT-5-2 TaxID=2866715 RepID=UPI0021B0BA1F|nr:CRISPR-associated helicase Cas3' [Streptomyces sp. BHT-5-2]